MAVSLLLAVPTRPNYPGKTHRNSWVK